MNRQLHQRNKRTQSSQRETEKEANRQHPPTTNAVKQQRHPVRWKSIVHRSSCYWLIMIYVPYESKACISWTIVLESIDNLSLGLAKLSLDWEHGGEDQYATHQADNIVHDRCGTAQLHGSLIPLHERGICQKGSKSSTYQDEIRSRPYLHRSFSTNHANQPLLFRHFVHL